MRVLLRLYRLGLRAYPIEFRARYGDEMARVFGEKLQDAKRSGWLATLRYCAGIITDLLISAARERVAGLDRKQAAASFPAILAGTFAAYVDFHATEVQATLLVLMATSFMLGYVVPKGAWRWALIIAALLPAMHLASVALHDGHSNERHPYFSRCMILAPAFVACFIGVYTGAFFRFVTGALTHQFRNKTGSGSPPGR
jgi:hypothetical protein